MPLTTRTLLAGLRRRPDPNRAAEYNGWDNVVLPALDFLAPGSVWRADFLGRALDVACYLPGAVLCLRWLESAAAAPGGGQWQPEAGSGSILAREKG